MKRIFLLTHLNGQDNKGGAAYGVAGTTVEVEDAVADDAIARGFATAARDDSTTQADPYAHLHVNAIQARANANSAQVAADRAQSDANKSQTDADAAKKVADDADAAANKAEHSAPYDAQGNPDAYPDPSARSAAQQSLADFNASHPDPLSPADQATKDNLTARRDQANVQPAPAPAPQPVGITTADEPGAPRATVA
jgi:hypothetical protein